MDLLYKHKHRKPTEFEIQIKEFLRWLKIELIYDREILRLDWIILRYDILIGSERFMNTMLRLIDAHDDQWDKIDDILVSYVECGRAKISRIWKDKTNGLD